MATRVVKSKTAQMPTIVGIGASAGGLEALEDFFEHVPEHSGLAFVIIQHLAPDKPDLMPEILQRITPMAVTQAKNKTQVKPNCIYIIPPNKDLSILHGSLYLLDPVAARGQRLPINFFFQSLANDQYDRAIAVILSGMGSDGTIGLKAIKENAGLVLVQSPDTAKFNSMPQNAINTGLVDIVAPADELAHRIIASLKHQPTATVRETLRDKEDNSALEKIIILLREYSGNDFSLYKVNTINRRIDRRMEIHQIDSMDIYVNYLRENSNELEILFKELLIGVTKFFRDPAVWVLLSEKFLPDIFSAYPNGQNLRAWVPACSTGEEAYSLAMTFKNVLDKLKPKQQFSLQIFATDLGLDAVNLARTGYYPASIEKEVPAEQLARHFTKDGLGYCINKNIREMVIFAEQNIIMDPPFTKLDILSCRNLLIYLTQPLQKRLIPLFHYALTNDGLLLLGNAETIGSNTHLFTSEDNNSHIYKRINNTKRFSDVTFPTRMFSLSSSNNDIKLSKANTMDDPVINLQSLADQVLLRQFSPVAVLINAEGDILYLNGRTSKYLEPAAGKANWNIYVMINDNLRHDLDMAIIKAKKQDEPVRVQGELILNDKTTHAVVLTVQLISTPEALSGLLIVVFNDVESAIQTASPSATINEKSLVVELQQAREVIKTMREERQIYVEELRSTNEEQQSTNEELQSTNEELTTSKEEMQSLNEELQTVNSELQSKIDDLSWVNNDMINLLNSTEIATLFLDAKLNVRRFTSFCSPLFKLIASDIGRPLSDIVTELNYPTLQDDASKVLNTLIFSEKQVTTGEGHWYKVRIMPYRTQDNVIDGVVITLMDINASKKLELKLRSDKDEK